MNDNKKVRELMKELEGIDYDLQQIMHDKKMSQYDKAILQRDVIQIYTNKINNWLNIATNEVYQKLP